MQGLTDVEAWTGVALIDFDVVRLLVEGIVARAEQSGRLWSDQVLPWWSSLVRP